MRGEYTREVPKELMMINFKEFVEYNAGEIYKHTDVTDTSFYYLFIMKMVHLGINTGMTTKIDFERKMKIIVKNRECSDSEIAGLKYARDNKQEMKVIIRRVVKKYENMTKYKIGFKRRVDSYAANKILNPVCSFEFQ